MSNRHPQMPVPLLDVNRGNHELRDEIFSAFSDIYDSGAFVNGPACSQLEGAIAHTCDTRFAVGCASGSDALLLALMALGIGPGDEVITPSFTFFATAAAIWRLGARPVFVEIEEDSFNLDPQHVAAAISPATKALLPVHLFGQAADMTALRAIAESRSIAIVEDAAQAIGARLEGRAVGSWGDIGCFSFYPTKNLGGLGDGGALTTNSEELAQKLRLLAAHGMQPRYYHSTVGINSRLDSLQAAALNIKVKHLRQYSSARRANAERYLQMFSEAGLDNRLVLPYAGPKREHVWNQFTIRVPDGQRDELRAALRERQIGSEIYYPVPLHAQECFRQLGYEPGCLPRTEKAAAEVLSLPIFPELRDAEQRTVVEAVSRFYSRKQVSAA